LLFTKPAGGDITSLDVAGAAMALVGFVVEVTADLQKRAFRSRKENADKFIKSGLWSISRHPNVRYGAG